jgi:hypothetical protein
MALTFISFNEKLKGDIIATSKGIKNFVKQEFWEDDFSIKDFENKENLQRFLQEEYNAAILGGFIISRKRISKRVENLLGLDGLVLSCFEPERGAIDDNFIVITLGRRVIGVIADEYDCERVAN